METVDFRKIVKDLDALTWEKGRFNNNGYMVGEIKYNGKFIATHSPWLRSTSGWTVFDGQYGKNYQVAFSMLPVQDGVPEENANMTEEYKTFIENMDEYVFQIAKENYQKWVKEKCPPDHVLREFQTSVIRPEQITPTGTYPERYQFKIPKELIDNGKFIGGAFEQNFDVEKKQIIPGHKDSKIEKLRQHARTRMEQALKSFYFAVKEEEQMGDIVKQVRFGVNWMPMKFLFYNVLSTMTDEDTLKSFTFGDVTVNESYSPSPIEGIQVEVIESGKDGKGGKRKLTNSSAVSQKRVKAI